jgi:hypothetical protein
MDVFNIEDLTQTLQQHLYVPKVTSEYHLSDLKSNRNDQFCCFDIIQTLTIVVHDDCAL